MEKLSKRSVQGGQAASVGRAADGVVILRPAIPPKHFTQRQIEKTVDGLRDARSGQFSKAAKTR